MIGKKSVGLLVAAIGVSLWSIAASPASAQNLIDTTYGAGAGSFELGTGDFGGNSFLSLSPGATNITGWVVGPEAGGVDWLLEPQHGAESGTHSLDLSGSGLGSISSSIPTQIGQQYLLSFFSYAGDVANVGSVSAGSLVDQLFSPATSPRSSPTYTPYEFFFTATSTTTNVVFSSVSSDTFGPILDSVSVTVAAPEPGSLAFLGMAALPLIGIVRRRKA